MGTENNAYGNFMFPSGAGMKYPWATVLPPTSRVAAYVRSTGPANGDSEEIKRMLYTTLASALTQCRPGYNDIIYVLEGHSESVTDATMLDDIVAGTQIIGVGNPLSSNAPVFRWTATGSQWTLDKADLGFYGLKLRLEGANGVVKAINITAANNTIMGCDIETASGAALKATIAIEVGSAALNCNISENNFRGTATHNSTDGIKVVGATVPSDLKICDNRMIFSATAANGLVHITVAALNMDISRNYMYNTMTSSTACIKVDNVACDVMMCDNRMMTKNDGTVTAQGIVLAGTNSLCGYFENYSCDEKNKSGVLTPVAAT